MCRTKAIPTPFAVAVITAVTLLNIDKEQQKQEEEENNNELPEQ